MEYIEKEVYFHKYCPKCKRWKLDEGEDPCNACLTNPVNEYSRKPLYFEERDAE